MLKFFINFVIDKDGILLYDINCSLFGQILNKHGRVPERPKGADCKSVADSFGGSNPPSPTKI